MTKLLLSAVVALGFSQATHAQCSIANPNACFCPTANSTNCLLLPDISAGKATLNSFAGWTEYGHTNNGNNNGLIRIDVSTPNVGWGPLDVFPTNDYVCGTDTFRNFTPPAGWICPDGSFAKRLIKQKLYTKNGATFVYSDRPAGWMAYHPTHGHIHVDNWGDYSIRMANPTIADTTQWPIVADGQKQSFCLIDLTTCSGAMGDCQDVAGNVMTNGSFPNFGLGNGGGCGSFQQGIGVGKVDVYSRSLDESFVKMPYEACNGDYFVLVKIDPLNHFLESNENNNWLAAKLNLTKQRTANTNPYSYIFSNKGRVICQGDSLVLTANGASNYLWSNGANSQSIVVRQSGNYTVRTTTPCGVATSDTFKVAVVGNGAVPDVVRNDTVCTGSYATLYASGSPYWYDAPTGGNLLAVGNNFTTGTLTANTTFYTSTAPLNVLDSGKLGPASQVIAGANQHFGQTSVDYLIFNAYVPFKLKTVLVTSNVAGNRIIQLRNMYGKLIAEKTVNLLGGPQQVTLDLFVPSGMNLQLGLKTGSAGNLLSNTTTAANIGYPYKMNAVATIVGSSQGDRTYPFFYNWSIETTPAACGQGSRKPVTAVVVQRPTISFNGLATSYLHTSAPAAFSVSPAGGVLNGEAINNGSFYPKLAGVGTHPITYTYKVGNCVTSNTQNVVVNFDDKVLGDGFNVEVFGVPGNNPKMVITSLNTSLVNIRFVNVLGQTVKTMALNVLSGSNYYPLDLSSLAKGTYSIQVFHGNNGHYKTVRIIN
jgi:hypothetical protein